MIDYILTSASVHSLIAAMEPGAIRSTIAARAAELRAYPVEHAAALLACAGVLYFMEIIYFMIAIAFLYGRAPAVGIGFLLSGLLSVQVIGLSMKKEPTRKVHLFLMEIHAAYSIPFLIGAFSGAVPVTGYDQAFIALRWVLVLIEICGVYLLTDERVRASFS
ncbi:MAG TPA: hypothetical protein VLM75_12255 [Spirochaetota bacterium]|nr:hypothetical protein [Spirochaetota bacterium]